MATSGTTQVTIRETETLCPSVLVTPERGILDLAPWICTGLGFGKETPLLDFHE